MVNARHCEEPENGYQRLEFPLREDLLRGVEGERLNLANEVVCLLSRHRHGNARAHGVVGFGRGFHVASTLSNSSSSTRGKITSRMRTSAQPASLRSST